MTIFLTIDNDNSATIGGDYITISRVEITTLPRFPFVSFDRFTDNLCDSFMCFVVVHDEEIVTPFSRFVKNFLKLFFTKKDSTNVESHEISYDVLFKITSQAYSQRHCFRFKFFSRHNYHLFDYSK